MTFTATYRGQDGALLSKVVEASDREQAVGELRRQGISPISLAKGGVVKAPRPPMRPWVWYGIGLVAILVGGLVWFVLPKNRVLAPKVESEVRPTPQKATAVAVPVKALTNKVTRLKRHRKPTMVPSVTQSILPPDLPVADNIPKYGEIKGSNIWPRALFKTREENLILGLLTAKPGSRVLVNHFMPGEEQRFLRALDLPVEPDEKDTPAEAELRNYMVGVKAELKEAVSKGEKILDIVQELRTQLNAQADYRQKLLQAHNLLLKEGTPEEAEQYRTEANKMLSEYGMDPLPLRSTQRARYERFMEEKKATQGQR